jgi:hypothetical protein
MLISEIREKTSQALLDFTWRQWAQAGVSANVAGDDRWAIDPEALVLFTVGLARRDPRLFDEMLDWLALNHKLLSMQRLRNLTSRFPVDAHLVSAVIAWTREPVPSQLPKGQQAADRPPEKVPVFSRDVIGFIAKADPTFKEFGFIRPRAIRSGKSREPDAMPPSNFAFQLRHLFGPGSRSEVMRVLLTYPHGPLDASRIADEAAFAKRNTSDALTALAASGTIKATWSGNERHFSADRGKWATILGRGQALDMPSFVSWVHLLPAALEIVLWLDGEANTTDSEYLVASKARGLMDRLARDLELAGVELPQGRPAHGTDYLPVFAQISHSLLIRLAASGLTHW